MGGNGHDWRVDCDLTDHAAPRRTVYESARADGHSEACATAQHMAMVGTCTCTVTAAPARRRGRPVWMRTAPASNAASVAELQARLSSPNGSMSLSEVVADIRAMRVGRHGKLPQSAVIANAGAWRDFYPREVA